MPIFIGDKLVSGGNGNAENTENKISSFSESDKTSTEKYPSSKAIWDTFLPRSGGTVTAPIFLNSGENTCGAYVYGNQYGAFLTTNDGYLFVSGDGRNLENQVGFRNYASSQDYNIFGQHNESSSPFLYLGGNRRTLYLDETNIDDIAETSLYNISCVGTHKLPFPFENSAWAFVLTLVHSHANSYRTQIIFDMNHRSWDYGGSCIAIRTMQNGTWQAWGINGNINQTSDLVAGQTTLTNGLCCLVYE